MSSSCPPRTPAPENADFNEITHSITGMLGGQNCVTGSASAQLSTNLLFANADALVGSEFSSGCTNIAASFGQTYSTMSNLMCNSKTAHANISSDTTAYASTNIKVIAPSNCVDSTFTLDGVTTTVSLHADVSATLDGMFTEESMTELSNAVKQDFSNMSETYDEGIGMASSSSVATAIQTMNDTEVNISSMIEAAQTTISNAFAEASTNIVVEGYCDVDISNITTDVAIDLIVSSALRASMSSMTDQLLASEIDTTVVNSLLSTNIGASIDDGNSSVIMIIVGIITLLIIAGIIIAVIKMKKK